MNSSIRRTVELAHKNNLENLDNIMLLPKGMAENLIINLEKSVDEISKLKKEIKELKEELFNLYTDLGEGSD